MYGGSWGGLRGLVERRNINVYGVCISQTRLGHGSSEGFGGDLVETPSGGDMEPQVATSYSQLGLPVEGEGHQHMHNTFNTKFDLLTIYAEIKLEQIEGLANQ